MSASPRSVSAIDRSLLAQLLSRSATNDYIKNGCLGFSAAVFVAWQYALGDGRTLLADSEVWASIDRLLPRGTLHRVRRVLERNFYLSPGDAQHKPWTLVTSAFSHISFGHIFANAVSFNQFARVFAILLPPIHFVGVILTSALAGSAAFLLQQSREKFSNRRVHALGLSGVTSGLAAMAAYLFPQARATVYGFEVPMWTAAAGYFAWDMFFLDSQKSTTGHAAHLGGAVAGLIYGVCLAAAGIVRPARFRT